MQYRAAIFGKVWFSGTVQSGAGGVILHCGASPQLQCFVMFSSRSSGYKLCGSVVEVSGPQLVDNVKNA